MKDFATKMSTLLLCLLLLAGVARAQESERTGTAAAPQLLVPVTARHAALGASLTSGINGMSGLEALVVNPAGITLNTGTAGLFSRMEYFADIGINHFGVAQRIGSNHIAFSLTSWDIGDIPLQTEASPDVSSLTYSASNLTAGVTFGRQLTDRIAAGVTFKAVTERIDDMSASAIAFDAGMTYAIGETGARLGVSVNHIGTSMAYSGTGLTRTVRLPGQDPSASVNAVVIEAEDAQLPTMLNFGASYTRALGADAAVTALANFRSNTFDQDQYAGALELNFRQLLFVRGGYEFVSDPGMRADKGYTLGAGLNLDVAGTRLSVDYAYKAADFLGNIQLFTASFTL